MNYDKHDRKLSKLQAEIDKLKRENTRLTSETDRVKEILESTLHEVRRFSAQLTKFSDRLSRGVSDTDGVTRQVAQSIFYTTGMISSRLAYTDIELNPRAIENQTPIRSGIYKKFDKAKRILSEEARDRGVNIEMEGASRVEIDALPVFELLPFVLLDNGIKYSPPNQTVTVEFDNVDRCQLVCVKSVGPSVEDSDLPNIFEKGYRGSQVACFPGEGLGLFLAKRVCEFHDIQIHAEIGRRDLYRIGGITYSDFIIVLKF